MSQTIPSKKSEYKKKEQIFYRIFFPITLVSGRDLTTIQGIWDPLAPICPPGFSYLTQQVRGSSYLDRGPVVLLFVLDADVPRQHTKSIDVQ